MYRWIMLLHVAAGFGFTLAHGISLGVTFKLRSERKADRIGVLLDLSRVSIIPAGVFMLVVLATGVALGFMGGWWGSLWIWVTIGIILVVWASMSLWGTRHLDSARMVLGLDTVYGGRTNKTDETSLDGKLEDLLSGRQPEILTSIGAVALVLILWLMMFKPF